MTEALAPEYLNIGPVPAGIGTFIFTGTLVTEDGVTPIPDGSLETLTLTLVDERTREVINSRNAQDVLNANGVTVDETTGELTWVSSAADNPFVKLAPPPLEGEIERHLAIFEWTWNDGSNALSGARKVFIFVEKYLGAAPRDGDGSVETSDYVYEADGETPVDDAQVWVTSDSAGTTVVAGPTYTNELGLWTLNLDPGTYYLWVSRPEFEVSGPNTLTVT